jgi:hypothetical protein
VTLIRWSYRTLDNMNVTSSHASLDEQQTPTVMLAKLSDTTAANRS